MSRNKRRKFDSNTSNNGGNKGNSLDSESYRVRENHRLGRDRSRRKIEGAAVRYCERIRRDLGSCPYDSKCVIMAANACSGWSYEEKGPTFVPELARRTLVTKSFLELGILK